MTDLVNLSRIQETSDGDLEFEVELIEMYLDDAKEHLKEIEEAMASGDIKQLRHAAHTLKGASANIGAVGIQNVAMVIEDQAVQGSLDNLEPQCISLKQAMEDTKIYYDNYVKTIT